MLSFIRALYENRPIFWFSLGLLAIAVFMFRRKQKQPELAGSIDRALPGILTTAGVFGTFFWNFFGTSRF